MRRRLAFAAGEQRGRRASVPRVRSRRPCRWRAVRRPVPDARQRRRRHERERWGRSECPLPSPNKSGQVRRCASCAVTALPGPGPGATPPPPAPVGAPLADMPSRATGPSRRGGAGPFSMLGPSRSTQRPDAARKRPAVQAPPMARAEASPDRRDACHPAGLPAFHRVSAASGVSIERSPAAGPRSRSDPPLPSRGAVLRFGPGAVRSVGFEPPAASQRSRCSGPRPVFRPKPWSR